MAKAKKAKTVKKPAKAPKAKPAPKTTVKTKPGAQAANAPVAVGVTSYQVGFGDCFLLTFDYGGGDKRHVLMDFGTKMRSKVGFKADMLGNAKQIAADCGGKLTMVVATHRHYDHISGFETKPDGTGSGDIIRGLKPELVIQPWTEDPKIAKDAKAPTAEQSHVASLANMQALANAVTFNIADVLKARSAGPAQELDYVGGDNITNKSAVESLMTMGKRPVLYLHLGSPLDVSDLLPGVTIHVFGPPTIDQATALNQNLLRYKASSDEYWKLQANVATGVARPAGAAGLAGRVRPEPPQARWFADRLRNVREDSMLQIVRTLDNTINNTSLILLMEVGDKKYLFPGDAQLENWSCALADPKIVDLLAGVNVYKVGHHGSLNATPISLWKKFSLRQNKSLRTLLSTHDGEYGQVPKDSLLAALKSDSQLLSTADFTADQHFGHVDI
ncbi:MAG TPA: hypothetical protein VHZ78_03390 [Rhizomicrobium sp.]|jgi:hypothetical protein|nr:hypothetical protein [Rhizomicrobium sp.]